MKFNHIDAKIKSLSPIGVKTMSELDQIKAINKTLLEALRLAEAECRIAAEECQMNNETHEGFEKASEIAQAAILEAGGQPIEFGIQ